MNEKSWSDFVTKWGDVATSPDTTVRGLSRIAGISRRQANKLIAFCKKNMGTQNATNSEKSEKVEDEKIDVLHKYDYYHNKETDTYVTFIKSATKPIVIPGHVHRSMKQAYSNWDGKPATINQICRRFSMTRPWFEDYKTIHGWTHDSEPFTTEELAEKSVETLVDDALQMRRQKIYQQYEISKWKEIQRDADKWNNFEQEFFNSFVERLNKSASSYQVPKLDIKSDQKQYILLMGLTDFHWGSYSWDKETRSPYNRVIAEKRLHKATQNILDKLSYKPEEIILPIGSDFFDVDGDIATTTKGTPQDIDGTPTEILVTGCELIRTYIDMLRQIAPVRLVLMSGNHDRHNGLALLMFLSAWYRNVDDVKVVQDYKPRVYLEYGKTLLTFSHGDGTSCKPKDLALIVAIEAREAWGRTENHLAFGGHFHHEKVEECGGLVHYQMPSLSGTTRWANRNGHVGGKPSLQAFAIDSDGVNSIYMFKE